MMNIVTHALQNIIRLEGHTLERMTPRELNNPNTVISASPNFIGRRHHFPTTPNLAVLRQPGVRVT